MSAIVALLLTLTFMAGTFVVVWLTLSVVTARRSGSRFFTRRRWRAVVERRAECVGGPMDGQTIPLSRAAALGFSLTDWPDVLYDATTGEYRFQSKGVVPNLDPRRCWAGYYQFSFQSDHYQWKGTGFEAFAHRTLDAWRSA